MGYERNKPSTKRQARWRTCLKGGGLEAVLVLLLVLVLLPYLPFTLPAGALAEDPVKVVPLAQARKTEVQSVAFSPDGKRLVSGHSDGTVILWDATASSPVAILKQHKDKVFVVAFSPDGKQFASGSTDQTVRLWDVARRRVQVVIGDQSNWVRTLQYTPDGKHLVVGCNDFTVRIWDTRTGKLARALDDRQNAVGRYAYSMALSQDGKYVAAVSRDFSIKLWEMATGKLQATLAGQYQHVAISPNGKYLVAVMGGMGGPFKLWEIGSGKELPFKLQEPPGYTFSIGFSPDGRRLTVGSTSFIAFADSQTGKSLGSLGPAHDDWVDSLAYSKDGRFLATASRDGTIRIWQIQKGAKLLTLLSLGGEWVMITPDGRLEASSGMGKLVSLKVDGQDQDFERYKAQHHTTGLLFQILK